jgi:hypothetical protein
VTDRRVLTAILKGAPTSLRAIGSKKGAAYTDGYAYRPRTSISQPYVIGFHDGGGSGNEGPQISTGSGYQAAVFGELVKRRFTLEIDETAAGNKPRKH